MVTALERLRKEGRTDHAELPTLIRTYPENFVQIGPEYYDIIVGLQWDR